MRKENFSVGMLDVDYIRGGGIDPFTKRFFLDPVNGSDGNDGKSISRAKKTWAAAEALLTTNKNEVLYMVGGASAVTTTSALDWDHSYNALIGLVAPVGFGVRNRIQTTTATASTTPLFTVSGNGNIFKNILFTQEGSHASYNAVALKVTGARNYFENVQARTIGALAVVEAAKRDLVIASANGENKFVGCVFGSDTYDGSANAANYVMEFNGANQTARNEFWDCKWLGSGSSGACWILATTVDCLSSYQLFMRPLFYNNAHGTMNAMTQGFNINASAGGELIFREPHIYGCTNLETSDSGLIIGDNVPAAATTGKILALTW